MIAVILLILLSFSTNGHAKCGRRPSGARVIGGEDAAPHSWPWQISLRVRGKHMCGGTLISPDWVLTAGHCVHGQLDPSGYTVVVGAHYKSGGETSAQKALNLKRIILQEGYTTNLLNDVALIQLARPVTLGSKVNTACLPTGEIAVGSKCYITGWGRMWGGTGTQGTLQQAMLPIAEHSLCRKQYRVDRTAHLCAGEARVGAAGGCNGDSGGPLVCEQSGVWVLHGAISYGARWCPTDYYTVFTRVSSYVAWINGKIDPTGGSGTVKPPVTPVTERPVTPSLAVTTLSPVTENPSGCIDKAQGCDATSSLCDTPIMKRYCRKTCSLC
ncbi:chymotrypsin-C isoform X2 [Nematostella vectensis]|uniref:chymotrypsin-C isoform X2 n=1 Tax=Nematostella vectensis TaxID=45351 RepID=UPI0020771DF6|nr:chymotrypsin-C isoform X2 [Nematostella vectensis]